MSEPGPGTAVTTTTAPLLIADAPSEWRLVLELVAQLVEADGPAVLPNIDHGRVEHFVLFWENIAAAPPWLKAVLRALRPAYVQRALSQNRRTSCPAMKKSK